MEAIYTPIRGLLSNYEGKDFTFQEVLATGDFSKYIYSYWRFTCNSTLPSLQSMHINLIPNGCIDLMFDANASQYVYIYGASEKIERQKILPSADIFAVRFLPLQINHFFKLPFEEIYHQPIRFNYLVKKNFIEIEKRLFAAQTFSERISVIEQYLKKQLNSNNHMANPNVLNAIQQIYLYRGDIQINSIANSIGLSSRGIRKLFKEYLGISPKKFAQIIRFQNAYGMLMNMEDEYVQIAIQNGYYDQSHFIKKFKEYTGNTPKKYI